MSESRRLVLSDVELAAQEYDFDTQKGNPTRDEEDYVLRVEFDQFRCRVTRRCSIWG
jgi:hypothetical protein